MSDRYINLDEMLAGMRSMLADKDPDAPATIVFKWFYDNVLEKAPTDDVKKVVHGHWNMRTFIVFDSEKIAYTCSECNTTWDANTNYCPNCGAKMDGGIKQ